MSHKIRFAVVGANRGDSFVQSARGLADEGELVAICDRDPKALEPWQGANGVRCYTDYEALLADDEVDAICIATPVPLHAAQSIAALNAGKHVICEVTAAYTLEECRGLIEAVERTGLTYMMAENYCFFRSVLMVQSMVDQGVFGDITMATGSYIHDCRDLVFTPEGDLTWRGELRQFAVGNHYPTHSLGPVSRWLGINRSDFFVNTATWQARGGALPRYMERNGISSPPSARPEWYECPDSVSSMLRTEKGILVELRLDGASARPHQMARYELQGTKASYCTSTNAGLDPLIWIEGRSPESATGGPTEWESLFKYAEEFEHPLWREHMAAARQAGHGGGDFFTLREFTQAIREQRPPLIDVYDAVTWSALTPLSQESVRLNNSSVPYPRFK